MAISPNSRLNKAATAQYIKKPAKPAAIPAAAALPVRPSFEPPPNSDSILSPQARQIFWPLAWKYSLTSGVLHTAQVRADDWENSALSNCREAASPGVCGTGSVFMIFRDAQ